MRKIRSEMIASLGMAWSFLTIIIIIFAKGFTDLLVLCPIVVYTFFLITYEIETWKNNEENISTPIKQKLTNVAILLFVCSAVLMYSTGFQNYILIPIILTIIAIIYLTYLLEKRDGLIMLPAIIFIAVNIVGFVAMIFDVISGRE